MKEYIEEIEQNIENIRSAIENQGVDIPEDTPLDEYADKIAEIERPTVKIGHDILPFYCYADNEVDASNKLKPTIEWNSEKATWDITEYEDGWTQLIPNDNPNKLLYAMFVPIKEGQKSSDDTFIWPKAIRLQGKKGEKGEEGNDGRDGVIAGMIQYLAAHLFKIVFREDVTKELITPELKYDFEQISNDANRHPKPNFLRIKNANDAFEAIPEKSTSSNNTWGLNYELPSDNPENYAVLKCVVSYNSVNNNVIVSDPIQLSGEGVVSWTEWYYVSDTIDIPDTSPSIENGWSENQIPDSFYEDSGLFYLWNRTQVNYDSGREILTDPILIMSSPKSINNIECLYGQSISIQIQPTEWSNDIPDDFIVLWKQETTNFTIGESKTITTPIAVKGNPGVDILGSINLDTLDTWTLTNMSNLDSAEYWFKKAIVVGKDLYIWIGSQDPSWLNQEDIYQTSTELCWIIIKDAFTTNVYADWLENDSTKLGYVKNRTHYESDIVKTYNLNLQEGNLKHYVEIEHNIDVPYVDFEIVNFEIDNSVINSSGEFEKVSNKIWRINGTSISLEIIRNSKLYLYHSSLPELEEYIPISITIKYNVLKKLDPKFVPQMIEITYDELVELRNSKQLIPGMQYRITDYITTTIQENTQSAKHQFDIIVTADDVNVLNENARAIQHTYADADYFANSNLNAWKIKYCLDNDTSRFTWADATNGKGVIYYMKDEWNNECPYDFKNIQFARWELSEPVGYRKNESAEWIEDSNVTGTYVLLKVGFYGLNNTDDYFTFGHYAKFRIKYTISANPTYCYTFGNDVDYSRNGSNYGNVIKEYKNSNKITLNDIVFLSGNCYSNTFGNNCYYNTFGDNCYSNTFGEMCFYNAFGSYYCTNTFGNNSTSNIFGKYCGINTIGNSCSANTFGNYCGTNTFGNNCDNNVFGNNCSTNTFGNSCGTNTFGNQCNYNTFGNNCYYNTFGNYCGTNTFGNNCDNNTFGLRDSPKSYYRRITFDNGNHYINLNCNSQTGKEYYQNVRIETGVNNTGSSKTINDSNVNQEYETVYRSKGSKPIEV